MVLPAIGLTRTHQGKPDRHRTNTPSYSNRQMQCKTSFQWVPVKAVSVVRSPSMDGLEGAEVASALARIRSQAAAGMYRVTQHAHQEMVHEQIGLNDVLAAPQRGEILEHYPQHRRGACCLVVGETDKGRPLHIFCTTAQPLLILITVYEPGPPKWVTSRKRRSLP